MADDLSKPTAAGIARQLYDQGLENDVLFDAMWSWHDRTGIEPAAIFREYTQLRDHRPEERQP